MLNPDRELLPDERFIEVQNNTIRESHRLKDKPSDALAESVTINNTNTTPDSISSPDNDDIVAITSGNDKESGHTHIEQSFTLC